MNLAGPTLGAAAIALRLLEPDPAEPGGGVPPGGYWDPGEAPETPPPDGHEKIVIGSVLVPLGTIALASGVTMSVLTAPGHCPDRLQALGSGDGLSSSECQGVFALNVVRASFGGLMLASGVAILVIGVRQKKRNEEWKKKRFRAAPFWAPGGAGVTTTLRF